jgi:hypothetical protein
VTKQRGDSPRHCTKSLEARQSNDRAAGARLPVNDYTGIFTGEAHCQKDVENRSHKDVTIRSLRVRLNSNIFDRDTSNKRVKQPTDRAE